ncbi:hypothetical protein B0H11DRAFT_2095864 [Mycena galericulata]|nr:hypothetical protein B0H11DRAFT_2095864 [Mycena galericulata]
MADPALGDPIGLTLLPPELAKQVQISTYVCIGALAVTVWDILNNLTLEYRLISQAKFGLPIVAYISARLSSLGYILGLSLLATYPIGRCGLVYRVVDSFYPVAIASNSALFFFRIRAIWGKTRLVTGLFGILWLGVAGMSTTIAFGGDAVAIGPTQYCLVSKLAPYVGASAIMVTVYDTAVFFAISYRLLTNTYVVHSPRELMKALFSGAYLPSFSRSLLVDGQLYYMISVISNIVVMTMVYVNVSPLYRGFLNIPNVALTSAMACRVYRNTKLGLTRESGNMALSLPSSAPTIPLVFTRSTTIRQTDNERNIDERTIDTGTSRTQDVDNVDPESKSKFQGVVHDSVEGHRRHSEIV